MAAICVDEIKKTDQAWADAEEVQHEYGLSIMTSPEQLTGRYAGIMLAVGHNEFIDLDLAPLKAEGAVVYDVKYLFPADAVDGRL